MKLGAQLFTLREYTQTEKDLDYSLMRVAKMGYSTVQISAIGPIAPEKVRELCDKHGLEIVLTHTDPGRILNDTEKVIKEHDIMGCDYIGIGMMPKKYCSPEWLWHFADDYKEAAKKIAADNPGKFFDGGFRVFKLADTNMADVYYSAGEYDQSMLDQLVSNIKPDRTDLDLLFGCLLEWGKSFCWSLEKDTCLRPGRNGSLTGKKISMWTLFFITVCSAAMC